MTTKKYHMGISVSGAIARLKRSRSKMSLLYDDQGFEMPRLKAIANLEAELEKGHEVIPFNKECDAWDYVTGCPGHEEPTHGDSEGSDVLLRP